MNDIEKTIETLEAFNKWRRDDTGNIVEPPCTAGLLGIAIDDACRLIKEQYQ